MSVSLTGAWEGFDGVDLPFRDERSLADVPEDVRYMSLARSLVLEELSKAADLKATLVEADEKAVAGQEQNACTFRQFMSEMELNWPVEDAQSSSPISGSPRPRGGAHLAAQLEGIAVAAPPMALRCNVAACEEKLGNAAVRESDADGAADEERPLLQSSTHSSQGSTVGGTPAWTQQHAASQSSLDGLFFEALVSQQLNLTLWRDAADPKEILKVIFAEVQRMEQTLCEETSQLAYVNAARFAEQRAYKRRRSGLDALATKSRAKVASLEKLLMLGEGEGPSRQADSAERLRLWLLE